MKCTAGSAHLVRDVDGRRSALEHRGNLGVLDRYPSLVQGSPTALARRGLLDLDKHAVTVLARLPTAQPLELVLGAHAGVRSEEHTSELQSRENLVCRLLL